MLRKSLSLGGRIGKRLLAPANCRRSARTGWRDRARRRSAWPPAADRSPRAEAPGRRRTVRARDSGRSRRQRCSGATAGKKSASARAMSAARRVAAIQRSVRAIARVMRSSSSRRDCEQRAARHQRGVGGEAAVRGGVPDMAGARGDQFLGIGLEQLHGIQRTGAQRGGVVRHARTADAVQSRRIDAGAAQVVLQAEPRRRHFGHRGEADSRRDRRCGNPAAARGR